jgi:hypothetical protein
MVYTVLTHSLGECVVCGVGWDNGPRWPYHLSFSYFVSCLVHRNNPPFRHSHSFSWPPSSACLLISHGLITRYVDVFLWKKNIYVILPTISLILSPKTSHPSKRISICAEYKYNILLSYVILNATKHNFKYKNKQHFILLSNIIYN